MNVSLWAVQALLDFAFVMAGSMKLTQSLVELQATQPWATGAMGQFARAIGAVEVAGALGLILPALTRIMPKLTPLAALGLLMTMLGAGATQVARGEFGNLAPVFVLGALTAFVAWGRWTKAAISPR